MYFILASLSDDYYIIEKTISDKIYDFVINTFSNIQKDKEFKMVEYVKILEIIGNLITSYNTVNELRRNTSEPAAGNVTQKNEEELIRYKITNLT